MGEILISIFPIKIFHSDAYYIFYCKNLHGHHPGRELSKFASQIFPHVHSSIFSPIKILHYTVATSYTSTGSCDVLRHVITIMYRDKMFDPYYSSMYNILSFNVSPFLFNCSC